MNLADFTRAWTSFCALVCCAAVSWASDLPVETFEGIEFVRIPAGTFTMGTSDAHRQQLVEAKAWTRFQQCEQPAHAVTLPKPFWISRCEVTQRQWKSVIKKNPSAFKGDDLPVDSVTWPEAHQFLQKLNGRTNGTFRLPTEAEWEFCARAGGTNLLGTAGSGTEIRLTDLAAFAWFRANAEGKPHPVGQKNANAWGLHDMLGNVWEWCEDWYDPQFYGKAVPLDPVNREPGAERVLRGGAWCLESGFIRPGLRSGQRPELRNQYVGFRIVRDADPEP